VVLERTPGPRVSSTHPWSCTECVAKWDGNRLTVWDPRKASIPSGENCRRCWAFHGQCSSHGHYMGGGFGSKLQPAVHDHSRTLRKMTARPVKLFLTREETYLCVGNLPPQHELKAGVKKDGTLTVSISLSRSGSIPLEAPRALIWCS